MVDDVRREYVAAVDSDRAPPIGAETVGVLSFPALVNSRLNQDIQAAAQWGAAGPPED